VTGNRISRVAEAGIGVFADEKASLSHVTVSQNQIVGPWGTLESFFRRIPAQRSLATLSRRTGSHAPKFVGILVDAGVAANSVISNLVFDDILMGIRVLGDP